MVRSIAVDLFSLKNKKQYFKMLSAALVIGTVRVKAGL